MCDNTLHLLTTTVGRLADVNVCLSTRLSACLICRWIVIAETLNIETFFLFEGTMAQAAVLYNTLTVQQCNYSSLQKSYSAGEQEEK